MWKRGERSEKRDKSKEHRSATCKEDRKGSHILKNRLENPKNLLQYLSMSPLRGGRVWEDRRQGGPGVRGGKKTKPDKT